jgi:hypothetical protein
VEGWGEVGGRGGLPLLIVLIDHISSGMSPTGRNRITWRKFLTNFEKSRYRSQFFFIESEKFDP